MTNYGADILSGKIDACEFVKLAVRRHEADLLRQDTEDFPYYFDQKAGEKAVKFLRLTRHYKGKWGGKVFEPAEWQKWCDIVFYGWKKRDGTRRFKYSYIEVPKKNGKSTWKAGSCLYSMVADNENSPEVYVAASKEAQARIILNDARRMAMNSPTILKRLKVYNFQISKPDDGGVMKALGSDSKKQDGLNISRGQIDEYHTHPTDEMYDILKQGTGAREQGIIDIITTAGYNKEFPCYDFRNHCINILQGKVRQDNLFTIIYTIDEGDDWKEESTWIKANPNWDIINQSDFKSEAEMAFSLKSEEPKFKTKRLCVWTDAADVFITDDDWMKCAVDEIDLTEFECWAGLDIAATVDVNSLTLLFKNGDKYFIKNWYWIPEKKVKEKVDRVNYDEWASQGYVIIMPGDALDDELLARDLIQIFTKYRVKHVAFDRYYSGGIVGRLLKSGFSEKKLHAYGQGYVSMSGPIRELERRVYLRTISHFSDPVLRWMCGNVVITMDPAGNVKFDKDKAVEKIDGMVSLAMAVGMEMSEPEEEKPYEDYSLRVLN